MAALMQLPVKFIWSHDAFRVGEDGPTHQPVEQEAQIRLMEKLKNHAGRNSMLVIRPADAQETTVAWQMAMENTHTPTALILSRQNIADLPEGNDYSQAQKGAYVVAGSDEDYEAVLVASGSEVSTLVAGAALLRKEGIHTRIVSVPSEGLFRSQPLEYQHQVVPVGAKVFGLTAGLPVNLQAFLIGADPESRIWGLESFGFSAPYKVLDEKLGYTAEHADNQVKAMLSYSSPFIPVYGTDNSISQRPCRIPDEAACKTLSGTSWHGLQRLRHLHPRQLRLSRLCPSPGLCRGGGHLPAGHRTVRIW